MRDGIHGIVNGEIETVLLSHKKRRCRKSKIMSQIFESPLPKNNSYKNKQGRGIAPLPLFVLPSYAGGGSPSRLI